MTSEYDLTLNLIKSSVSSFFSRSRGFRRKGQRFFRISGGLQHAAFLSKSQFSPYFRLEYSVTWLVEEDIDLTGPAMIPDAFGDCGWLSGRNPGSLSLFDATVEMPLDLRQDLIHSFLERDASLWFQRVADVAHFKELITSSATREIPNLIVFEKAYRKLGIIRARS